MRITSERLPWLPDEPVNASRAEAPPAPPRSAPGRAMWPWYLLLLGLIALVVGGAWWLATRQGDAPPPQLPAEEPVAIPVTRVEPAPVPAPALPPEEDVATRAITAPAQVVGPAPAQTRSAPPPDASAEPVGEGEAEAPADPLGRSVFPADEPVTVAPPVTGPAPVPVYRVPSNRGRVLQLGAFPTRAQAEETWKRVIRRYPYLASKPKMVNVVYVRALGGRRQTRMYRLQLGTSSQAQSVVICQQLERAGQSCVVVY